MTLYTIALFGEAEKGQFQTPYYCDSLPQLVDFFGEPPPESQGLHYAVQALLYQRQLIFFRVEAEGFSDVDYFSGIRFLQSEKKLSDLTAICIPGVGDKLLFDALTPVCELYKSILISTEKDLYDFLTFSK